MTLTQDLDPTDWDNTVQCFNDSVAHCIQRMRTVRERPVWQPVPDSVKLALHEPLPGDGISLSALLDFFNENIAPYGTGNTHPRFYGWVHGSGNVAGVLGDMLAAFMNCNVGGRDHIGVYVERQVVDWCKELFNFEPSSSGLVTSGTSSSTQIALTVARNKAGGPDVQRNGLHSLEKPLVGYCSSEAHTCIAKTFETLGLGVSSLRKVPVNDLYQMNTAVLVQFIRDDIADGFQPFAVIATAGTVNTGAIDDIDAMSAICERHKLWLHVDGAFGALATQCTRFHKRLRGIATADSVAFDFHKWLHVPYDAGCVLIKDAQAHRDSFSSRPDYLSSSQQGLGGGDPWFCELGPDLSRGFRALKVWFTIKALGMRRLTECIDRNCDQAIALADIVLKTDNLELLADVALNIVCFRFVDSTLSQSQLDVLNNRIVEELQLRGLAAPSTTRIDYKTSIRVCFTNHRTTESDVEALPEIVCKLGHELKGRTIE